MAQALAAAEPFRDPSLPLERRVDDLISRLSLDELKASDLTYWEAARQSFVVEPGAVDIMVGASSADARVEKTISVTR
jgi:hypothetical protein